MRKGGSLIAFTACIFALIAAVVLVVVSQLALLSSGDNSMEMNQAITCVAFCFAVLICSSLGLYVRNPIPGYFCIVISSFGAVMAPVSAMPFLGLAAVGSLFMIIGGHVDHHRCVMEKREKELSKCQSI